MYYKIRAENKVLRFKLLGLELWLSHYLSSSKLRCISVFYGSLSATKMQETTHKPSCHFPLCQILFEDNLDLFCINDTIVLIMKIISIKLAINVVKMITVYQVLIHKKVMCLLVIEVCYSNNSKIRGHIKEQKRHINHKVVVMISRSVLNLISILSIGFPECKSEWFLF